MLKFLIFVCFLATTYAASEDFIERIIDKDFINTKTNPSSTSFSKRPVNFNGHLHGGQPISREVGHGDFRDKQQVQTPSEGNFGQRILRNSRAPNKGVSSFTKPVLETERENTLIEHRINKVAEGSSKEGIQIGPPGAVLRRGIDSFSHRSGKHVDVSESNPHPQSQIFLRNSLDRQEDTRKGRTSKVLQGGLYRQEQLDDQSSVTGKERPLRQVAGGISGFPGSISPVGNFGSSFGTGGGDPFRGNIGNFGAANLGAGFGDPFRGSVGNIGAFGGGFGDQFRGNVGNFGNGLVDPFRGNIGNLGAASLGGNVGNIGAFGGGFGDQFRGNVGNLGNGFGDPLRGNIGNLGVTSLGGNIGNFGAGFGVPFSGNIGNFGTQSLGAGLGIPLGGNVGNFGTLPLGAGLGGNVGNLGTVSLGDPLRGNVGNLGISSLGTGLIDPIRGNIGNLGIPSLGAGLGDSRLQSFGGLNNTPFGTTFGGIVDPLRANVGLSPGILGVGTGSLNAISPNGLGNSLLFRNIGGSALLNQPFVGGVGGLPIGGLPGGLLGRGPVIDPLIGRLPIGDRLGLSLRGRDDSRGLIIDNFGRLTFGDRPGPSDILDQTPLGPVIEEKPLTRDSNNERTTTSGRGSSFQRTGSFVLSR